MLLPEFQKHGRHPGRRYLVDGQLVAARYDPWWWPLDPATKPEHWGLDAAHSDALQSLHERRATSKQFPGFLGSLGAQRGCVFILGERPSFNVSYASAVTSLYEQIQRLSRMPELVERIGSSVTFHVSDLLKFRGENWNDGLTELMLEISGACLHEEMKLLQPSLVIVTDMARRRLQKVEQHLPAEVVSQLREHPASIVVPHWKTARARSDGWSGMVRAALRHFQR
jgi:hypothetical protein